MSRWRNLILSALIVSVTGACGDDSGTDPETAALSKQESQLVIAALYYEVAMAMSNMEFTSAYALSSSSSEPFSFSGPCSAGGTISGSGDFTSTLNDNASGVIAVEMQYTPDNCIVNAGAKQLSVDGDPSLNYEWSATYSNGELAGNIQYRGSGGIRWTGNSSGSCTLDYTMSITPQGQSTIAGTMCGQDVSGTM